MASHSNSSIAAWLDWYGKDDLPDMLPCKYANYTGVDFEYGESPSFDDASCLEVCNDGASMFYDQGRNLVTCGIWTSLLSASTVSDSDNILKFNNNSDFTNQLELFAGTGLNSSVFQYAPLYAGLISDCLEAIYVNVKKLSYADNGQVPSACTNSQLFPLGSNENTTYYITDALKDCIDSICAPLTLNPDLAGVGVFSSFMIQSGIAIFALAGLLGLEIALRNFRKISSIPHTQNLIAALVDFHKAQCYFSSVIQIAALTLFHDSRKESREKTNEPDAFKDLFGTSVLLVLATGGFIPVNMTLACITRYGRQSWYLLTLTLITTILASATLIASYNYSQKWGKDQYYDNNLNEDYRDFNFYGSNATATCNIKTTVGETLIPLCGNSHLVNNALPSSIVANWWTWVAWVNCVIWLFVCIGRKAYDVDRLSGFRSSIRTLGTRMPWTKTIGSEHHVHITWIVVACIPWCLCFTAQFYLFAAFFKHDLIDYKWSFGQIIALSIWVPSVVEYIYIEFNGIKNSSKYRYPSPLIVTEESRRSSITLNNLTSPEINRNEVYPFASQAGSALLEDSSYKR